MLRSTSFATLNVSRAGPRRFERRGGRKRIVTPDGREMPAAEPQPDGTLVKALAQALAVEVHTR